MSKCFVEGVGGGGGTGGTLTVTAPVGVTVIATNEALGKTISKAVNAEGIAVLKGLKTGTWMLSVTNGEITSTPAPVEIVADYEKTLTFFSAEINVTYPIGSTVTCTCGTVQLASTQVEDANGSAKFIVPNAGTWVITSTANDGSGKAKSQSVEITTEGQIESVTLVEIILYDGAKGGISTLAGNFIYLRDSTTGGSDKIIFNADNMVLPGMWNDTRFSALATEKKIDMSKVDTLYITYTAVRGSETDSANTSEEQYFGVTKTSLVKNTATRPTSNAAAKVKMGNAASAKTISLDVSSISGACHVFVESVSRRITVYKIWAE